MKAIGALAGFLSLCCTAFAIAIIAVVAAELWPGAGYYTGCIENPTTGDTECQTYWLDGVCLMTDNSVNVCRYSYSAGAIGLVVSAVCCFAMCLPAIVTLLLSLFNTIWWLAYSITATVYNNSVSDQSINVAGVQINYGYPRGNYRNAVIGLAWTTFALSLVCVVLAAAMMKNKPAAKAGKADAEATPAYPPAPAVV